MVLIQQEDTDEHNANSPQAATAKSSITTTIADADGFETASDTDLATGDDDNGGGEAHKEKTALDQANDAKLEGNKLFGDGQYEEALSQYELALQVAADMASSVEIRSICHANRAVCFMKLGKYDSTIKECTKAIELNPVYVKAMIRRGEAHEKLENYEEAIADMKKILEIDPSNDQARKTIRRLEPLAAEKMEKKKEEMIEKLKDLGNSVLGRFGMSIDNFKAVKDPKTGNVGDQNNKTNTDEGFEHFLGDHRTALTKVHHMIQNGLKSGGLGSMEDLKHEKR
ncbi:Tetratricopeptide repeat protein 1 [Senna tora]|uniref:Tetratricopeptide repeat protein 1 n=1 Tax=Senna tora TaxID=362788 RepID=A0A834WJX0_9FABA|nr:Tetratricopeptide repeat protein 1 [Senna tora]